MPGVTTANAARPPVLSSAVIVGSSVYPETKLFSVYGVQLGRPLTSAAASAVTGALAHLYERDGYSRPELQVDGRPLAVGILRIEIFEPRFTRVTFTGHSGPYTATLTALGARIRASQPVRPTEVQAALAAMRALPGLSVNAATARDTAVRNGFVLTLNTAYRPVEGLVRVSNRGSKEIGPVFVDGQVVANDLLGHGEKLGLLYTAATDYAEYHAAGAFGDLPMGGHGLHVSLLGLHSWSDPHESPVDLDDIYTRTLAMLRVAQPVWISGASSLALSAGLDLDNQLTDRSGARLRDDRLRIADLGGQAAWGAGAGNRFGATLDLRRGLDGLGSGLFAADLVPDKRRGDFLLARVHFTELSILSERWSLRVDALAQHSGYVLPYSEQLQIGGVVLGQGFEVTQVAGDSGADARFELRRSLGLQSVSRKISLYGYYDYGAVWSQDGSPSQSAAILGAGVAVTRGALSGYVELAQPLIHPDVDGSRSPRLLAEIAWRF